LRGHFFVLQSELRAASSLQRQALNARRYVSIAPPQKRSQNPKSASVVSSEK
jgi:hypothetical protein